MNKVNYFFFCCIFAAMLFWSQAVFAAESETGFSINPFYQSIDVPQEQEEVPFSVEVKNNTPSPAVFRILVLDFGTLNESGGVAFLGSSDNLKYSLASWISLSNDTLVLEPGQAQTVRGTIENKQSLSPGGHYGAIMFKIEDGSSQTADQKDQVAFNPSLASLLFVRKVGGEVYGLHLDKQEVKKNIFSLPARADLRFQNTGNVHVTPRGSVVVKDPLGRVVSKSIINEQSSIVLPETFRVLSSKFTSLKPALIPGRYTLTTEYRYDGLNIFSESTQTLLLIPPLFLLAVIVLLAAIILAGWFVRKRKRV